VLKQLENLVASLHSDLKTTQEGKPRVVLKQMGDRGLEIAISTSGPSLSYFLSAAYKICATSKGTRYAKGKGEDAVLHPLETTVKIVKNVSCFGSYFNCGGL
jgi:hypothetical protein